MLGKILIGSSLTGLMLLGLIPAMIFASDHGETDLHPWLEQPVCTWIPPLQYPGAVKDKSMSGDVVVLVTVDGKGKFRDTELLESELPELFIVEALKAVRRSRFKSRQVDGEGVQSSLVLTFHFDPLADPPPPEEPVEISAAVAPIREQNIPPTTTDADTDLAQADVEPGPEQLEAPVEAELPTEAEAEEAGTEVSVEPVATTGSEVTTKPEVDIKTKATESSSQLVFAAAAFGTGVSARQIVGAGDVFELGGKVYFWTKIDGGGEGVIIKHAWRWRGRVIQTLELTLKGSSWRTWSYKTMYPGMEGAWSVDVLDGDDNLLGSRNFTCIPMVKTDAEAGSSSSDDPDSSGEPATPDDSSAPD